MKKTQSQQDSRQACQAGQAGCHNPQMTYHFHHQLMTKSISIFMKETIYISELAHGNENSKLCSHPYSFRALVPTKKKK
jgi:hypothetical protein